MNGTSFIGSNSIREIRKTESGFVTERSRTRVKDDVVCKACDGLKKQRCNVETCLMPCVKMLLCLFQKRR